MKHRAEKTCGFVMVSLFATFAPINNFSYQRCWEFPAIQPWDTTGRWIMHINVYQRVIFQVSLTDENGGYSTPLQIQQCFAKPCVWWVSIIGWNLVFWMLWIPEKWNECPWYMYDDPPLHTVRRHLFSFYEPNIQSSKSCIFMSKSTCKYIKLHVGAYLFSTISEFRTTKV